MTRVCSICTHDQVNEINAALARGNAYRTIAHEHAVSPDAVRRHALAHLPLDVMASEEARKEVQAADLFQQTGELHSRALALLTQGEKAGDLRAAVAAVHAARGCLELSAKMRAAAVVLEREAAEREAARSQGSELAHISDEELTLRSAVSLVEEGWSVTTPDGRPVEAADYETYLTALAVADGWPADHNPFYWDAWLRGKPHASRPG